MGFMFRGRIFWGDLYTGGVSTGFYGICEAEKLNEMKFSKVEALNCER